MRVVTPGQRGGPARRHPAVSRLSSWAAVLFVSFVVAACSPTGGFLGGSEGSEWVASTRGESEAASGVAVPAGVELPLDWAARMFAEVGGLESRLFFEFMARCMAEAGFRWDPPPETPVPPGWTETEWVEILRFPARYGLVTDIQAAKVAYRDPEGAFVEESEQGFGEEGLPRDPAERAAFEAVWFGSGGEYGPGDELVEIRDPLTGEPLMAVNSADRAGLYGGGCQGRANEWLTGDLADVGELEGEPSVFAAPGLVSAWIQATIGRVFDEVLSDDRVIVAAAEWRQCMVDRGNDLPEFRLPGGLIAPDASLRQREAVERHLGVSELWTVDVAVADVACQREIDWLERLRRVEAEYQQEVVERAPELFDRARKLLESYAARLADLRLDEAPVETGSG